MSVSYDYNFKFFSWLGMEMLSSYGIIKNNSEFDSLNVNYFGYGHKRFYGASGN